jgi:hypothetical protein
MRSSRFAFTESTVGNFTDSIPTAIVSGVALSFNVDKTDRLPSHHFDVARKGKLTQLSRTAYSGSATAHPATQTSMKTETQAIANSFWFI